MPRDELRSTLLRDGWVVLRGAVDPALIATIEAELAPRFAATPFCDGGFYGGLTKRFGGLLKRSARAADLVQHADVLGIASEVLAPHCDRLQLNLTQALEIHPGESMQPPHRDEDMWGGPKGGMEYLVNVMWPLTAFRHANGATLVFPESCNGARGQGAPPLAGPVAVEMEPGDALLFLGSTLHAGGANVTERPRTGIIVSYCLGWLKPFENQWLVYPPDVAKGFSSELAALVGYQQHRPNLGNYEGQCPSVLLRDGPVPDALGAVDELRPEQAQAIAAWRAAQMRG